MKLFLTILAIWIPCSTLAAPKIDMDAVWACTLAESNDDNIAVGTTTRKMSLRNISEHGMIKMSQGLSISLYSSLETYYVGGPDSGYLALATKPTEQKELHGSILVSAKSDRRIDLEVSVFQTTRVYDPANGFPVFIFKKTPKTYKLNCEKV